MLIPEETNASVTLCAMKVRIGPQTFYTVSVAQLLEEILFSREKKAITSSRQPKQWIAAFQPCPRIGTGGGGHENLPFDYTTTTWTFSLSFQSAFQLSFTLLVRYRVCDNI